MLIESVSGKNLQIISRDLIEVLSKHSVGGCKEKRIHNWYRWNLAALHLTCSVINCCYGLDPYRDHDFRCASRATECSNV